MKKTNLLYGAATLALALTGCSNELPTPEDPVTSNDEIRFVRIAIANPPSTRADGDTEGEEGTGTGEGDDSNTTDNKFQAGTADENQINDAYFIFYDRDGNVVGANSIIDKTLNLVDGPADKPSIGKMAAATVQLQIPKGSKRPAYVMAFLNPVDYSEVSSQSNMNELRSSIRTRYKCDHGLFAMNNSAYYGPNVISGESNVKMFATPVLEDQLHTTQAAAEAADAASTIDIYVERYAAKVNFTLDMSGIEDQTIGDYTLTFKPVAWTINADAPTMYASKRFETSNATDNLVPTYDQVQQTLGTWTSWNDEPNHRSYWACSPGYYATKFPNVSDDIIEEARKKAPVEEGEETEEEDETTDETNLPTGAGEKVGDFELKYYSYNQIADQTSTNTSTGKGITAFNSADSKQNWKYVLENTMGQKAFECLNPKAAAPSVVIVGEYEIKKGGTTINWGDNRTSPGFCIYADNLYFIDERPNNATDAKTIKTALMDQNGILAVDQNGTLMKSTNANAVLNCLEVVHPVLAVRGDMKVPHRYVTLQLKQNLTADQLQGLYYKPANSDTWKQVAPAEINAINKLLWAQLGNARIYTQNKGYISIPIQHLGISENKVANAENSPIAEDGSINWNNVRVGDFGLVRNHVYTLEASAIKGMASGIDGLDNPLVPSMEDDDYWVKYKINILNWRVVPTQGNIILK